MRAAIVETFGCQASRSVQQTLYGIADVVLSSYQEISDITFSLHERPYRPVDLFSAGVENPDDLFVAVEEPVGVIEVTVERTRVNDSCQRHASLSVPVSLQDPRFNSGRSVFTIASSRASSLSSRAERSLNTAYDWSVGLASPLSTMPWRAASLLFSRIG